MALTPPRVHVAARLVALAAASAVALPAAAQAAPAQSSQAAVVAARKPRPQQPTSAPRPTATPVLQGVRYTWPYVSRASRFRVLWSAKPYGGFLDRFVSSAPGGWVAASSRTQTLRVAPAYSANVGQRAIQTALPYGNPVYARLQANNAYAGPGVRYSPWTAATFPAIPTPADGTPVRMGTWNLSQNEDDARIASVVQAQGLSVLALQEARGNSVSRTNVAGRMARRLGWADAGTEIFQQQRIIYDARKYDLLGSGDLTITSYQTGGTINAPWVRLRPVGGGTTFTVVSAHVPDSRSTSATTRAAQYATDGVQLAQQAERVSNGGPVIIGADLCSNREPYAVPTSAAQREGAPQALVAHGYWDSRASLRRYGTQWSTGNKDRYPQELKPLGSATRADYIMSRGINGSFQYVNLGNQPNPVSDHNLVWSDLKVPS